MSTTINEWEGGIVSIKSTERHGDEIVEMPGKEKKIRGGGWGGFRIQKQKRREKAAEETRAQRTPDD